MTSKVLAWRRGCVIFGEQFEIITSRDKLHHMVIATEKISKITLSSL